MFYRRGYESADWIPILSPLDQQQGGDDVDGDGGSDGGEDGDGDGGGDGVNQLWIFQRKLISSYAKFSTQTSSTCSSCKIDWTRESNSPLFFLIFNCSTAFNWSNWQATTFLVKFTFIDFANSSPCPCSTYTKRLRSWKIFCKTLSNCINCGSSIETLNKSSSKSKWVLLKRSQRGTR